MEKKLCVVGLGYIGLPTAVMFANSGLQVHGVDRNERVVGLINNKQLHIEENGLQERLEQAVDTGHFRASTTPVEADVYIITIPFSTIMLRGFFDNVPDSLEEAAMVDGCSRFTALWRVLVPVMTPGIVATFIFNFVNSWNELFLAVTLINSDSRKTIPTALNGFISSFNIEWGPMSAAAVLTILPTMVLFAFASRWIVAGLTAGATKG